MRDIKCQIQFTGNMRDTINIKSTQFDVTVSEMQKSVDFCGRLKPLCENIQSPFSTPDGL